MEKPPQYSASEDPHEQEYVGNVAPPYTSHQPPENPGYPSANQEAGNQAQRDYEATGYTHHEQDHPPQDPRYYPQGQRHPLQDPGYQPRGQEYLPQRNIQQSVGCTNTSSVSYSPSTPLIPMHAQLSPGIGRVMETYMALSVVSCLFFLPIGIFAIVKSSEAQNRYMAGDYAGAMASAKLAKNLAISVIVLGLSIFISGMIFTIIWASA
ncbi:uncharacterized protein LOC114525483 isoform X1 [Dendronephthya gigantea]|uniref:uncharacterized protein LOC114525483 isoform X1 n=1 Tax=Dendronephthya gigantea TaxID=151771 RepID=UPI0010696C7C|nr:uncharacterized protein LOC114525483 isoform X1 [Dendronephthya gigantea]XP_028402655.1 uncharacterized protein LOC114525483 isoform X1 [Dendronephthya gigantea]